MDYKEFLMSISEQQTKLITPLHEVALTKDCKYRIEINDKEKVIVYSARNYRVHIKADGVAFDGDFDNRAFLRLYNETENKTVKELLFNNIDSCCYCIDDKCTTFLMAKQRTLELDGKTKKICGPFLFQHRHHLYINVTEENLLACLLIAQMMFEYAYSYPDMHNDLTVINNNITYTLAEKSDFYIVGYKQKHSQLSPSDEEFVSSLLQKDDNGKCKIDTLLEAINQADNGQYVGVTDDFINGISYNFIFGVITDKKPKTLPDGMDCLKIRRGEWAIYNSSANDYKSIWKHYTGSFYNAEHKGYDKTRVPFEYYDENGNFYDVHIPVDADMPADSGRFCTLLHAPNTMLAGYLNFAESDYPLFKDRPFEEFKKVMQLFPYADNVVRVSIHSLFGKPLMGFEGVAVDDYTVIPKDVEFYEMKGGYWRLLGWRHFNGGIEGWDEAFQIKIDSRLRLFDINHPRGFNQYVYNARGGYVEIGLPLRVIGKWTYEVIDLAPQRIIGKLESPPESVVTEADKQSFYTMSENIDKGSYMIGFTLIRMSKSYVYYDKPLIKGIPVKPDTSIPDGLLEFVLDGGRYVKITEDVPNGELGWELGEMLDGVERETGYAIDTSRQYIYKQCNFGKSFELYVPCG